MPTNEHLPKQEFHLHLKPSLSRFKSNFYLRELKQQTVAWFKLHNIEYTICPPFTLWSRTRKWEADCSLRW